MSKETRRLRKREGRLSAKVARILADNGAECPDDVAALVQLVSTLPRGKDLAAQIPSLSHVGLCMVRGQARAYAKKLQEERDRFDLVAETLNSKFGDKAELRSLSHHGKDWHADVWILGKEQVWVYDHEAPDLAAFLERIIREVGTDLGRPLVLPTIDPTKLAALRRRAADAAESRYFGWLAKWRSQYPRGPEPTAYATLGEWSDGESNASWRYHFEEQFDERIQDEIREELINVVLAGLTDERYMDRVREAFWDSDQAVEIESSLEEYWRSLPAPETTPIPGEGRP
ncbi:MAG: hypothetical protein JO034_03585 [Singulisphaera sp.]|nr:hypothetical protein [Singulisphaera sp.]